MRNDYLEEGQCHPSYEQGFARSVRNIVITSSHHQQLNTSSNRICCSRSTRKNAAACILVLASLKRRTVFHVIIRCKLQGILDRCYYWIITMIIGAMNVSKGSQYTCLQGRTNLS